MGAFQGDAGGGGAPGGGLLGALQGIMGDSPEEREQNLAAISELAKGAAAMQKGIGALGQSTIPQRAESFAVQKMGEAVQAGQIAPPQDPVRAAEMLRRLGISGV